MVIFFIGKSILYKRGNTMKIIAHRGSGGTYKENTKEAILNSLNQDYVDGVEFDIRMTKDHKFIIHHDPFYEGKLISVTKYTHLKKLPELEDILKSIQSKKIIMIEIKEEIGKYKIVVYYLYKILKKYNLNFYICSFNYKLMKYFLQKHPNIITGLIIGMRINEKYINNVFMVVVNNEVALKIEDNIKNKENVYSLKLTSSNKTLLMISLPRKIRSKIINIIKTYDKDAIILSEKVKVFNHV